MKRYGAMPAEIVDYVVVLITAASQLEAEAIARSLVEVQLAACVNILPIQSIYHWEGKLEHQQEWQLLIKTRISLFAEVTAHIQAMHSYDIPEIIALPIVAGALPYLNWVSKQVK